MSRRHTASLLLRICRKALQDSGIGHVLFPPLAKGCAWLLFVSLNSYRFLACSWTPFDLVTRSISNDLSMMLDHPCRDGLACFARLLVATRLAQRRLLISWTFLHRLQSRASFVAAEVCGRLSTHLPVFRAFSCKIISQNCVFSTSSP